MLPCASAVWIWSRLSFRRSRVTGAERAGQRSVTRSPGPVAAPPDFSVVARLQQQQPAAHRGEGEHDDQQPAEETPH